MCPYCGSSNLDDPKPLVSDGAEELAKLGIKVPHIQMCKNCDATLSPESFVPGTSAYCDCKSRIH
jgi:hypothetical protein